MEKDWLLLNIEKIHSTEMGIERIKRNLKLETEDVIEFCKTKIRNKNAIIYKKGKNWYVEVENYKITINASSYTLITAHQKN